MPSSILHPLSSLAGRPIFVSGVAGCSSLPACAWRPPGILVAIPPAQRPNKTRNPVKAEDRFARKSQDRNPSTLRSSAPEDGQSERGPQPGIQVCATPPCKRYTFIQTSGTSGSATAPRQTPASLNYLRRHAGPGRDSNPARPCRIQLHFAVDAGRAGLRQVEPLDDGRERRDQDQVWQSGGRNHL